MRTSLSGAVLFRLCDGRERSWRRLAPVGCSPSPANSRASAGTYGPVCVTFARVECVDGQSVLRSGLMSASAPPRPGWQPCAAWGLQGQLRSCGAGEKGGEMTTSGRDAHRSAGAIAPAGSSGPTRRPRTSSPDNRLALRLIGLGVVIHMLRSRRFFERVAVGAIVLAAVRNLGQEKRASTFERLAAWNKRQVEILERKAERQARRVEREAKRQARRVERTAKRQARRLAIRAKLGPADRELGQTDGQLAAGGGGR